MSLRLNGSTSGYTELDAGAVAGNNVIKMPASNGSAYQVLRNGATPGTTEFADQLVRETAKAYDWNGLTNNTSIDFTGIPSWAKRITVMLKGVSLSGTSNYLLQVGSGSFAITGYASGAVSVSVSTAGTTNGSATTFTTGIIAGGYTNTAASVAHGHVVFTNIDGNTWVASGTLFAEGALRVANFAGSIALSGTLDRVRITTVNGTDAFDGGTVNILYE